MDQVLACEKVERLLCPDRRHGRSCGEGTPRPLSPQANTLSVGYSRHQCAYVRAPLWWSPRHPLDDELRGDYRPAILGELEEGLVETGGWASDRAAPVRAELEVIAEG